MWGSDFPHPEGTWPHTANYFAETFSGFPIDAGKAILGGNASRFYGMDGDYLRTVADEIGPDASIFN
jgi:predicted TIM-barrel fold metal-dependent hydrolase